MNKRIVRWAAEIVDKLFPAVNHGGTYRRIARRRSLVPCYGREQGTAGRIYASSNDGGGTE